MSWINDVKTEILELELSKKKLRNFGLLVGGIVILISIWFYFKKSNYTTSYILLIFGAILVLSGIVVPLLLKVPYKIWMGLSFAIGWVVSRILITSLYFIVVTPLGLIAKLVGKKFLDRDYDDKKDSYWILKPNNKKIDYKKMY